MAKKSKLFFIIAISSVLFFSVTNNKDAIKSNLSWIFEGQNEAQTLPELSNEEIEKSAINYEDKNSQKRFEN